MNPKGSLVMNKLFIVLFSVTLLAAHSAFSQPYHWDGGPTTLMNDTTVWWGIIGDHTQDDGHCDNTSENGTPYPDVDCAHWNDHPTAVIASAEQDCGTGSCTVSATVRCLYLHPKPNPYPQGSYVTFSCTGPATGADGGVVAGNLGNGRKGVRCGNVSCGCELVCPPGGLQWSAGVWVRCHNQFFGFPQMVGGNTSNYVCQ